MQISKLIILLFLTLGQAYPYADAYSFYQDASECDCCQKQNSGCAHCAQFGHGHSKQNKKSIDSVSPSPCHTPIERAQLNFSTENFLIPQFVFSKIDVLRPYSLKDDFTLQEVIFSLIKPPARLIVS